MSGEVIGGLFFLGLGAVFALDAAGDAERSAHGLGVVAGGGLLAIFGAFIMFLSTVASQYFWPVILIALGLFILARGYLPRSHSN
ncbi:MAG: hypothetical protein U0559_19650 [Anaerolineae bacterium]